MIINENSIIHKFMETHSKCIDESYDEYIKERENYENCEKTVESPDKNTVNNANDNDENKTPETGKNDAKKSVFDKLKEGGDTNKKKAFKLFAGIRKNADDQPKEESSEATVAYQPAVANNLYGNTGVTNQITFSPATDFRTVEERINELFTRLILETDRNKILYIVNKIINLVPDKEAFKKTLLSKLKG